MARVHHVSLGHKRDKRSPISFFLSLFLDADEKKEFQILSRHFSSKQRVVVVVVVVVVENLFER